MAKRQHSVSLSFILLRFVVVMLGCMLLCCLAWLSGMTLLQKVEIVYPGYVANQQAEQILVKEPKTFVSPGKDFLPEYALFRSDGEVLESNVKGKKLKALAEFFQENTNEMRVSRYSYEDGSILVIRWHYRKEFVNPVLRSILPPFEYLWWGILGVAWLLCLLVNTVWLRRYLADRVKLFSEVSERVGNQELDFEIPYAGIREFDQALHAMDDMRKALYSSLSAQWMAQQEREEEIAALAHDLKTPLTLIGGNAELLLEEKLPENSYKRVKTIMSSNQQVKKYVTSLLETANGSDDVFECIDLNELFEEVYQNTIPVAEKYRVHLQMKNDLQGAAKIQKEHMLRALGNIVQNAIEHTPEGRNVYLKGTMTEKGWQVFVRDEGSGFSKAALHHATERLWRGDAARALDGHNGLGLWFAAQVVKTHAGQLELSNGKFGGIVKMEFYNLQER